MQGTSEFLLVGEPFPLSMPAWLNQRAGVALAGGSPHFHRTNSDTAYRRSPTIRNS